MVIANRFLDFFIKETLVISIFIKEKTSLHQMETENTVQIACIRVNLKNIFKRNSRSNSGKTLYFIFQLLNLHEVYLHHLRFNKFFFLRVTERARISFQLLY